MIGNVGHAGGLTVWLAVVLVAGVLNGCDLQGDKPLMAVEPLPYAENALEPVISARTMSFHYGKHHQGYDNKVNAMIAGTEFEKASLQEIIMGTAGKADQSSLFNNAAQVFNHSFYWKSMKPGGGGEPGGRIAERIKSSFILIRITKLSGD